MDNYNPLEVSTEQLTEQQRIYTEIVAKYYGDPEYKAKLEANPSEILSAEGIIFPAGAEVRLLFNTDTLLHIVLPAKDALGLNK
jgi:hypothetical protein